MQHSEAKMIIIRGLTNTNQQKEQKKKHMHLKKPTDQQPILPIVHKKLGSEIQKKTSKIRTKENKGNRKTLPNEEDSIKLGKQPNTTQPN